MSLCFYTLHIDSRNSDLIIAARVDPSKSLALCQDKNTFHAMYPEDKKRTC